VEISHGETKERKDMEKKCFTDKAQVRLVMKVDSLP
jgi:hypothetical protein